MRFETDIDLQREQRAIELYTSTFKLRYQKLGPNDVDYRLLDADGKIVGYAEVKGRIRTMRDAFPLPISIRKIAKLIEKYNKPVVIWACEDGIYYADIRELRGTIVFGGMAPRPNAVNDEELMAYYEKQKAIRYIRFS